MNQSKNEGRVSPSSRCQAPTVAPPSRGGDERGYTSPPRVALCQYVGPGDVREIALGQKPDWQRSTAPRSTAAMVLLGAPPCASL